MVDEFVHTWTHVPRARSSTRSSRAGYKRFLESTQMLKLESASNGSSSWVSQVWSLFPLVMRDGPLRQLACRLVTSRAIPSTACGKRISYPRTLWSSACKLGRPRFLRLFKPPGKVGCLDALRLSEHLFPSPSRTGPHSSVIQNVDTRGLTRRLQSVNYKPTTVASTGRLGNSEIASVHCHGERSDE